MATLEVHDGRGRVDRVGITPDDPVIFGTSAACSLVLEGDGIAPVHGRIRWQKRRYKVDAGADIDSVEVNGKRVKSSTLYQGDEIRVGPCRIFVISTEDRPATTLEDDKTRIQEAPKAYGHAHASPQPVARPGAVFEAPSFANALESQPRPEPLRRQRPWKKAVVVADAEPEAIPKGSKLAARIRSALAGAGNAPGEERVVSSPVVLGLAVMLVILLLSSVGLWRIIAKTTAERQYTKAFQSLDDGDYRNAIKQLDQFLEANPADRRSAKAKVFRALAKVRQFTTASGASWENAFQAAQTMVAEVGKLDEFRDASTELAEQLIKTVEGLAERARGSADPELLRTAEAAMALESRVAGKASENLLGRSRAPAKLAEAREAIRKAQSKARGLAAIDAALGAGSPAEAYLARDEMVATYADFASDRDVVARLGRANELIRKAASFDPSGRPGETEPHPEPLGPPTTLILRLDPGSKPAGGPPVYALADGLAYGLDGATGAPLWQVPVGLSSPFPPQAIGGGDPSVLAVDARYDELVRLDGRTGKLAWRQELGERVVDPPLVLGNQVYQATPSGKILAIDLASGSLRGTLNLGRPLARGPVGDESGEHLYILADEDCLFVLGREPMSCQAVEYMGHEPGSIACTPARVGRFLVVAENSGLVDGVWRVFVLDEAGGSPKPRQTIPVVGWTWRTPSTSGSVLWSASDRGEVVAHSIGLYDADRPLKPIASIGADNQASGPAFGLARSEREFWLASGRSGRYDLNSETGKLAMAWGLGQAGGAVAPIQVADRLVVCSHQSTDGSGVALTAVDPQSGTVRWRTTLGARWPVAIVPGRRDGDFETLGFDGLGLTIARESIARGGFVEQALAIPGTFRVPSVGSLWLACGEATVLVPSATASHMLVRRGGGKFQSVDLPSPLGARPIAWGGAVLVPGADGRVYLIDPATGESAADPFVPRFDKARPARWRTPVLLDGDAVALAEQDGLIRRLVRATTPRPRLVVTAEASIGAPLAAGPATTGGAVLVATADDKIRALAARDLSPVTTVDLPSPRTLGPVAEGGHGFAADASGDVFAFSADGRKLWQTKLRSAPDDAPGVRGGVAWFVTRSGTAESRGLSDGSTAERLTLGILPAGPPLVSGGRLVVPTGLGSLRPVSLDQTPVRGP